MCFVSFCCLFCLVYCLPFGGEQIASRLNDQRIVSVKKPPVSSRRPFLTTVQCGAIDVGHAEGHLGLMINERDCSVCRRIEFIVVGHICSFFSLCFRLFSLSL